MMLAAGSTGLHVLISTRAGRYALSVALLIALMLSARAGRAAAVAAPSLVIEFWEGNAGRALRPLRSAAPAGGAILTVDELPLVRTEPVLLRLEQATYRLDQEGLYRIRRKGSPEPVRQMILYRGDGWRFAGHLSRLYVYGTRHQGENQAAWDERVRKGEPLSLQCLLISTFVRHHLAAQQIPARLVHCVNGSDWNHYTDGHALLELCDPTEKRWIVFDPTLGTRFRRGGHWLDLVELTQCYRSGRRPEIQFLNAASKLDPHTDYEALFAPYIPDKKALAAQAAGFTNLLQNDRETLHHWYARVMQIPLIGNSFVPGSDAEDALLRTLPPWKALERLSVAQFRERFYGEP